MSDTAEPPRPAPELTLHASCVAWGGRGLLILGGAGSGKSTLALGLMAFGAELVADDRTHLWRHGGQVMAAAPESIAGLVEARGIGILNAKALAQAPLAAVVDLDQQTRERLPGRHQVSLLGRDFPLLNGPMSPALPAALVQYLKGGRNA